MKMECPKCEGKLEFMAVGENCACAMCMECMSVYDLTLLYEPDHNRLGIMSPVRKGKLMESYLLSKEGLDYLRACREEGLNNTQIADSLGVHATLIGRYIQKYPEVAQALSKENVGKKAKRK